MPELPEIETIRRSLLQNIGAAIKGIEIRRPDIIRAQEYPADQLIGQQIRELRRRGKYLILDLNPGYALVVHLGMSGRFYMLGEDVVPSAPHIHMVFHLDNQHQLIYMDARRFGGIWFLSDTECIFRRMGVEPLSSGFTNRCLQEICQDRKVAIKTLLLNQNQIAGIGNIYADEALFAAHIRPERPAGSLCAAEIKRLRLAIVTILQASIDHRGTTFRDFRDGYNKAGEFQQWLQVYGKTDCPCNICGSKLKKKVIGGRSSHYCEHCQK